MHDEIGDSLGLNSVTPASDNVRMLYASLTLAAKTLGMYPQGHSTSSNTVRQFYAYLEDFNRRYGEFRLDIEKDRMTCSSEVLQSGMPEEGTLHFTLFRDGIRWLAFREGVTLDEVSTVLGIINRYSVLVAEPDGDIVTDFWEGRFPHIHYEVADFFPGFEDSSHEGISGFQRVGTDASRQEECPGQPPYQAIKPEEILLSADEQQRLKEMIISQESDSGEQHTRTLLDMLIHQQDPNVFTGILDILSDEFSGFLVKQQYHEALILVDGLRRIQQYEHLMVTNAIEMIDKFFVAASNPNNLEAPSVIWESLSAQQIQNMINIFYHLTPHATEALMQILLEHLPRHLEDAVVKVMRDLIMRDFTVLDGLVNHSDDRVPIRLVSVLSGLHPDSSVPWLLKLSRHPSAHVRRLAIKGIFQAGAFQLKDLMICLDDPDQAVRRTILQELGRCGKIDTEDQLMQYLSRRKFTIDQADHVMECFRVLGRCGSARCVPFLRGILWRRKWLSAIKPLRIQQGAALALCQMKIPEVTAVIEEAVRSIFPGPRKLIQSALGESPEATKG